MSDTAQTPGRSLAFNGYNRKQTDDPDMYLCSVGRGTPGGEYLRRFWHPVCYLSELGDVPLRVRALGEDLVAFRDGRGEVGVLHLRCCHRNTSLEFGFIEQRGIRCCYHGRVFDTDGTCIEIPGDPAAERLMSEVSQGGYPTHVFAGMVFVYMGPPDRIPVFPHLDRFDIPGVKLVEGERLQVECNWIQIKENALDAHHTTILHTIPQRRGIEHFATEFDVVPDLTFMATPGGFIYLGARKVGDKLWVRSAETYGPNIHTISSIFENGSRLVDATPPFLTLWTLPVDDDLSINFFISHVGENERMPFDKRRALELFGQRGQRSYRERQWIPGDHDAQVGQGPVNVHAMEHLGTHDRGIVMFRRYVRQGIRAVEKGQDPAGFYMTEAEIAPTFASDRVIPISEMDGSPDNPADIIATAERIGRAYLQRPPMEMLKDAARAHVPA